jgi:type IV pilus assembly protein PilV
MRPGRCSQGGVALLESLVAMLVVTFGVLGLVGLQARAMQHSASAEDTSRAALLANEVATVLWSRRDATLPEDALAEWQARVADPAQGGLTNGVGMVTVAAGMVVIELKWQPPKARADAWNRYVTQVPAQVVMP